MYSYFSDLHVDLLAQALLEPGEQRIGQTVGRYVPWWAFGFVNETTLVIATDRRLIFVEHRMAWLHQAVKLHSVHSVPWHGVQETRVAGLFAKKLVVRGQGQNGPVAKKLGIPNPLFGLLAPMRNNVAGARAVAAGFQASRGLAAAPAYAPLPQASYAATPQAPALPAPQAYAPQAYAPQAYAPQAYAQQAGYADPSQAYAQPPPAPVPAFNAPGYTSVPPSAAAPLGIAPTPPRMSAGPRPGQG